MADQASVSITFLTFIALFIGVGLYSNVRPSVPKKESHPPASLESPTSPDHSSAVPPHEETNDYLLAGRNVNPWFTALSTVATGNSGFKFIGLVGFTYEIGLAAIWLTIGFIVGDIVAWLTVHRRLRQLSEMHNASTIPSFLGQANGQPTGQGHSNERGEQRGITIATALVTLTFLSIYAAAQLHAGSKALSVLFGWDAWAGVTFGAAVVGIYCVSGGIRSSIWVGSVQAILMLISMVSLCGVAIASCGGFTGLWHQLNGIAPSLTHLRPTQLRFGFWPFAIAWAASGFGVIGQPHLMIRAMAIESGEKVSKARNIYMAFNILFTGAATLVGLTARVLLPGLEGVDTELALPQLAMTLLPGFMVGLVLVGLFSATISTADAQILSCSAALSQDLRPQDVLTTKIAPPVAKTLALKPTTWAKLSTLAMVGLTLLMALALTDNVFVLVTFAWSALASGLAPLMLVRVFRQPLDTGVAIAMMTAGIGTALVWRIGLNLSQDIYEVLPGMVASLAIYGLFRCVIAIGNGPSENRGLEQ